MSMTAKTIIGMEIHIMRIPCLTTGRHLAIKNKLLTDEKG